MYIPVGAFCPPLEKQLAMRWRMGVPTAPIPWPAGRRFSEGEHCVSLQRVASGVCSPGGELLSRDRDALLMHGTEGEVTPAAALSADQPD